MVNMNSNTHTINNRTTVNMMLSRTECNILRGIAIVGIVLHNYCHWLRPIVQENEYQFKQHNVDWFHNIITHSFNELTIFHLLSFFGHYGVPIFLFLSAYGLVIKYETTNNIENQPTVYRFLRFHWLKLFRMMIVGFSAFILVDAITEGQHHYKVIDIVAQIGLFNNVLPNPDDIIWPGPYWFFGLMLQLYIVYRLFLYKKNWIWIVLLIAICTIIELKCAPNGEALNRWRYNFVGGMLPFGLGLLYAKYMRNTTLYAYVIMFVCSLLLIWYGSNSFFVWLFVPMFVCFPSDISGINSSTTTYIIAPAAKLKKYGSNGTTCVANKMVMIEAIGSTNPDKTPYMKVFHFGIFSALSGIETIAPSGKF